MERSDSPPTESTDQYVRSWEAYKLGHTQVCLLCIANKGVLTGKCYPHVQNAWFYQIQEERKHMKQNAEPVYDLSNPADSAPVSIAFRPEAVTLIAGGLRHLIKDLKYRADKVSAKRGEEMRQQIEEAKHVLAEIGKFQLAIANDAGRSTDPTS